MMIHVKGVMIHWIQTHKKLAVLVLLVLLGVAAYGSYGTYKSYKARAYLIGEVRDAERLASDPKTKDTFAELQKHLAAFAADPTKIGPRYDIALDWKILGEITKERKYLERSARMYDEIADLLGDKSYLPYLNAGNVYRAMGEHGTSEERYRVAITLSPGEPANYLALVELYRYYTNKSEEEVIKVFDEALSRLVESDPILVAYAGYLRDTGRTEAAISLYEKLDAKYPGLYQSIILELQRGG